MLSEYFVQFGIILFPICAYQIWAFSKSFNELPQKTWVMGIYGGLSAILCQVMPIHILGLSENFQCVPIILSILYGKRRSGGISIAILAAYQTTTQPHVAIPAIIGTLVYSAIPMMLCTQFGLYARRKRLVIASILSVVTLIVELLFIVIYFIVVFGKDSIDKLQPYFEFLIVACFIQITLMTIAFVLLENIIQNGRMRERYESLIKYNPVGICVYDMDKRFIAVNSAYEVITGYKESELIGKSRFELWFEEDHDFAEEVVDKVLHREIKKDVEVSIRHKDGHKVQVRFTIVPMMEGENTVGYFAMVTDITESRVAEEALRNSEKLSAIGQLAAGVAHEIRNPLTAIKGFVQLLSSSCAPSETKYYDIMKSELSRIEGIVSEMLVLAKPQIASFRVVNVTEKLAEVVHLLAAQANMNGVQIEIDFHHEKSSVMGDGNQLKQVFLNLAKNAIEAMPNGGTLCISLAQEANSVMVKFTDNGDGIPEEWLEKVGQPFYTTKTKGTGLGFMVSRRIIDHHNGFIDIASTLGCGTTVSVSLPLHVDIGESVGEIV